MDKVALIAGNVFVGLAALVYFVPYQLVLAEEPRNDGGLLWAHLLLHLPLLGLLGLAYSAVVWRGGLDAWDWQRASQYGFVWLACVTLLSTSFCSGVFRYEPRQQVPWMVRLVSGWAAYLVPLLLLLVAVLWLNAVGPAVLFRKAFGLLSAFGIGMGVLLAGEGMLAVLRSQQQQLAARQAYAGERDVSMLAEVERADAVNGFGSLLPHTSKWESEPIRALALRKVRSVPNLNSLLGLHLRNMHYGDALTFLRDNDVANGGAVAEAVRDAIVLASRNLKERVDNNRDLWRDDLEAEASKIRDVAAKFGGYGVDLKTAVLDYEELLAQARKLER